MGVSLLVVEVSAKECTCCSSRRAPQWISNHVTGLHDQGENSVYAANARPSHYRATTAISYLFFTPGCSM